jgi:hypothetical protein
LIDSSLAAPIEIEIEEASHVEQAMAPSTRGDR